MKRSLEQSLVTAPGAGWNLAIGGLTAQNPCGWFDQAGQGPTDRELHLRLKERREDRARIARELHDTLFQGFLGASMVLHNAVESLPEDAPEKPSLSRALNVIRRVIDEGRHALRGLRSCPIAGTPLESALAEVAEEFPNKGAQLRVLVMGQPTALNPTIEEQVYLICREALVNALRHSGASSIEADLEYLRDRVRVVVRDNGCGIDPQEFRSRQGMHWGLRGMQERATTIGAQFRVWSRPGSGTEVEVSVPIAPASEGQPKLDESDVSATQTEDSARTDRELSLTTRC